MRVLKFTLAICMVAGFWQPSSWTSLYKHVIYKTYAMFLISSLYIFSLSQFINIIFNVDNPDEFVDSIYMMLTVFVAGYKQVCMWIDHKNIATLINLLTEAPFSPTEMYEVTIRQKFDKMIRDNSIVYLILITMTVVSILVSAFFMDYLKGNLTYRAWVPFDYSDPVIFTLVYIHQMIGMSTSGLVNVACESVLCGLLLQICCQFEILEYRMTKIVQNKNVLSDCVRHHNRIFEYANTVNSTFAKIIAMQFTSSMLVVCSSLYQIAMTEDYMSYIPIICYTNGILAQIFIYCWFGNEVKLKSLQFMNRIYDMDWPSSGNKNKKALLVIMERTLTPIEFNSAYVITMNLDSFVALLKLSYSTFNLLRQTRE